MFGDQEVIKVTGGQKGGVMGMRPLYREEKRHQSFLSLYHVTTHREGINSRLQVKKGALTTKQDGQNLDLGLFSL